MAYAVYTRDTGQNLTHATIIVAGIAALIASLLSIVSIWHQAKNYRKPLLQRYVIRILLMVPIYSFSSWTSILSSKAGLLVDPIRDVYEAFTIYTFFQLLINFIGGERALIIMMHGREPVHHLWPLNYCLPTVDISDPHIFLAVKRGILQYAWLKPILGLISVVMKGTGTYKEGYIGLDSGYFWSGIAYNISVSVSLYSLGLFWVCMAQDLQPFRPVPKFLCIKLIIFASYWQGFLLSTMVWLGAIPDNIEGYSSDNLAATIQDALICLEMPLFAAGHWYAFSWHDYADATVSAARMPVKYAIRDSFGIRDLIEDTKETFSGKKYEYRLFDSGDNVLAHEGSTSRIARLKEGMRYERGGKGKYWIPKPGESSSKTPLVSKTAGHLSLMNNVPSDLASTDPFNSGYGSSHSDALLLDTEDECFYKKARALEYGDWNYPVITAHEASPERWLEESPALLTTSTHRNIFQPTEDNQILRAKNIRDKVELISGKSTKYHKKTKGKSKENAYSRQQIGSADDSQSDASAVIDPQVQQSSVSVSGNSGKSQLVDLVIEDTAAEYNERIRARKEGSAGWNISEPKRYVRRTFGEHAGEDIREGFEPTNDPSIIVSKYENEVNNMLGKSYEGKSFDGLGERRRWEEVRFQPLELKPKYGIDGEVFEDIWGRKETSKSPE